LIEQLQPPEGAPMAIMLSIIDFIVVLLVVFNVSRSVWAGLGASSSPLLAAVATIAILIFGLVSLCATDGLTTNATFHQVAILIFLLPTALLSFSWKMQ
jgi:hypothetical protein